MGLTTNRLTDYLIAEIDDLDVATELRYFVNVLALYLVDRKAPRNFIIPTKSFLTFCLSGLASQVSSDWKRKVLTYRCYAQKGSTSQSQNNYKRM